jgi:hypothetical protein
VKVENPKDTKVDAGSGQTGGGVREPWNRQPIGPPGDSDDTTLLHWLLLTVEDELNKFVFHHEEHLPGKWRNNCQKFWPTIERRFKNAHATLVREEAWRAYDGASRDIDRQKDALLDDISVRLQQNATEAPIFTIRWSLH